MVITPLKLRDLRTGKFLSKKPDFNHRCDLCHGSTYIRKDNGLPCWRSYENMKICSRCWSKKVGNRLFRNPESPTYLVKFIDKNVYLGFNPKKGYCSICPNNKSDGSCKRTGMHHIQYGDKPLDHTVELCASCHAKIEWQKRKSNNLARLNNNK